MLNPATLPIFITAFLAATVEMVEALTIVLAIGVTRGWRTALIGAATALALLAVIILVFGHVVVSIPFQQLHLVVGAILLIFGLQWLKKAILRSAGLLPLHNEDKAFQRDQTEANAQPRDDQQLLDPYGFTVVFKGVLLEGLEVVFIVLTVGAIYHNAQIAALGAAAGVLTVGVLGALVHRPLSKIPENTMKFVVAVMLTAFGLFWGGGGAGIHWPGGTLALLGLIAFIVLVSISLVAALRQVASKLVRAT